MSGELEAAGALATAGVVGAAMEGREGGAPGEGDCPNCGTKVTGRYCSNCGQHAHPNRKLTGVITEFLHGLWNFDTKAWRTVPMLVVRPGTLTRNYVYGKRARYLAPLTMFLFAIFLMFFAFSTINPPQNIRDTNEVQVTQQDLTEARQELAQVQAELENARAHPDPDEPAGLEVRLAENAVRLAQAQVDRLERQLTRAQAREAERAQQRADAPVQVNVDRGNEPAATPSATPPVVPPATDGAAPQPDAPAAPATENDEQIETWQDGLRALGSSDDFVVFGGANEELNQRVRSKLQNPDLALYQIQDAASKFSFLLAPLSLPFIALLFLWKRGTTLYDHMAYALYALAFAALLFSAAVLLGEVPFIGWSAAWLLLVLPVHMWFHLKGAYALGWWSATWRTILMLNFSYIVATTFTVLVIVLGLAG